MSPFKQWILALSSLFALSAAALSTAQVFHYITLQDKSEKTITTYTSIDACMFLPSGLTALVAQIYFGVRCFKVSRSPEIADGVQAGAGSDKADGQLPFPSFTQLFDHSRWIGLLVATSVACCAGSCVVVTVVVRKCEISWLSSSCTSHAPRASLASVPRMLTAQPFLRRLPPERLTTDDGQRGGKPHLFDRTILLCCPYSS